MTTVITLFQNSFFRNNHHSYGFISLICKYYPINNATIIKYEKFIENEDLSMNEKISWSDDFIEEHLDLLNWQILSKNKAVNWHVGLIERYKDNWFWEEEYEYNHNNDDERQYYQPGFLWHGLSENRAIPWSKELICSYLQFWDWYQLSSNPALPWSEEFIDYFSEKWDWENLSANENLPWTIDFFYKYDGKWNKRGIRKNKKVFEIKENFFNRGLVFDLDTIYGIKILSSNEKFNWTIDIIDKFRDSWDWIELSQNKSLPWSIELINRFVNYWHWHSLSFNKSIPWSTEIIEKFEKRWNWKVLSENTVLPWSIELIEKYKNKWFFGNYDLNFNSLLTRDSDGYIHTNERKIEILNKNIENGRFGLSSNTGLPWTEFLIKKYKNDWEWQGLSRNEAIPWTLNLIENYLSQWNWHYLFQNNSIVKLIMENIDDNIVTIIFENYSQYQLDEIH